jgi:fumarate hydratase subunit alpha
MSEISADQITEAVRQMCIDANTDIGDDILGAFKEARKTEASSVALTIIDQIEENATIAAKEKMPYCQDTGFACFLVEVGQDVRIMGGLLEGAINEGVRRGYKEGYLRASIVSDPIERENTKDNTPAHIHVKLVEGDRVCIKFSAKGSGSENMSQLKMLKPSDGLEGVKDFIVQVASDAGPNACPPIIVCVGIGGTFDRAAFLAKKGIFREAGKPNPDPFYASLEQELLERINKLGFGPQGLGGTTCALAVHVEAYPCHIASLPVPWPSTWRPIPATSHRSPSR